MNAFLSLFLAVTTFFTGFASQIDYLFRPAHYNAMTIQTDHLPAPVETPAVDDFIQLSDVRMHYRVYGSGKRPLILIHGNGGSVNSLKEAASYLANDYTVYLPESRCHGESSDPGVISYDLMAMDLLEFIDAFGLEKPILMGHSDGGITAITLAFLAPDVPGAVISCGANSHPRTFKPYFPLGVAIKNIFKKDKLNDMMLTLPDFTPELLSRITCPTYLVSGQFDILWNSDTVYLHENIAGSDMAIIRGATHSSYISQDGKQAYALARPWLVGKGLD